MPDNMNKVGVVAEVATAASAVAYPLIRLVGRHLERVRERRAKEYRAPAAAVEARLIERYAGLEARMTELERLLQ